MQWMRFGKKLFIHPSSGTTPPPQFESTCNTKPCKTFRDECSNMKYLLTADQQERVRRVVALSCMHFVVLLVVLMPFWTQHRVYVHVRSGIFLLACSWWDQTSRRNESNRQIGRSNCTRILYTWFETRWRKAFHSPDHRNRWKSCSLVGEMEAKIQIYFVRPRLLELQRNPNTKQDTEQSSSETLRGSLSKQEARTVVIANADIPLEKGTA